MKTYVYLFAGLLITAISFISCDNTEKEPSGEPDKVGVELIAQYENTLLEYVDVEATWIDSNGTMRHASPAPHYLEHGNRQYSRITIDTEFLHLPSSTEVTLTYKVRDGVVEEDGFVDIPQDGIDVIVYTGATVTKTYGTSTSFSTTYDIASFIQQGVLQTEFLDMVDYLNTNFNKIYVSADSDGKITTNSTPEEIQEEEESQESDD